MTTYKRICIKDSFVEAQNGDRQEIKCGREYITSAVNKDGDVIVFTGPFWAPFPVDVFEGDVKFT